MNLSVQVCFKIVEVPKVAKINKEMVILKLPLQKNRQKTAKKGNGYHIITKNGSTFIKKATVRHNPVYEFEKK